MAAYDGRMRRTVPILLMALLLSGCSGGAGTEPTVGGPTVPAVGSTAVATPTTSAAPSTSAAGGSVLAQAVQEQVDWFLGLLNGAPFDEDDYSSRFARAFLDQVPADQFIEVVDQIRAAAAECPAAATESCPRCCRLPFWRCARRLQESESASASEKRRFVDCREQTH